MPVSSRVALSSAFSLAYSGWKTYLCKSDQLWLKPQYNEWAEACAANFTWLTVWQ